MTIKNSTRLLAILLTLAMVLPFASCDLLKGLGGSLKLESFIVDPTSIKTEYVVGEEVDFSGIKATAKYSDETLNKTYTANELTITYADDITATVGKKEVTVSFKDPNLGVVQEVKITITVVKDASEITTSDPDHTTTPAPGPDETTPEPGPDETTPEPGPDETTPDPDPGVTPPKPNEIELEVIGFDTPGTLVHFAAANKEAGTLTYGQDGFSGQFAIGGQVYVIGNQNAFTLNPTAEILNFNTDEEFTTKEFYSTVVISIKKDDAYVELTADAKGNNVVEYYDGDVLIATVNTYKGIYQFTADAADAEVKISVAPSEEHYIVYAEDFPPIVLEAKIINAYNVYEAWQLAVVDNYNEEWADHKATHGLTNVTVSGIVLHNDIKLTANDVPQSFFYTTTADVVYRNTVTGETVTIPAGTKYFKDWTFIYERDGVADFAIEGNFFTLSTKNFPLIPSPAVFGKDAGKDYEEDFSNAALFKFNSVDWDTVASGTIPTEVSDVTINNIAIIGNSSRDNLVDAEENLASAGGLIFVKTSHYTQMSMNNVIGNSFFITYFVDYGGNIVVRDSKCYDSYQNAAFVWSSSTLEMINTYVNGCGGPAIIAQSVIAENGHPTVTVTGGKLETHLSGQEIWFTAVNANAIVSQITALGAGLQQAGLGNFVDANGKMNIEAALMANGSKADEIVTGIDAQGKLIIETDGIDRTQSMENANWMAIYQISQYAAQAGGQMPPFFTVYDAEGTAYSFYYNGVTFVVGAEQTPLGTDASHAAIIAALMQADTITLTQGGLSVVFEYYHY